MIWELNIIDFENDFTYFPNKPTRTSVFSGDFVHLSLIVLLFFSPSGLSVELYGAINFSPPPGPEQ